MTLALCPDFVFCLMKYLLELADSVLRTYCVTNIKTDLINRSLKGGQKPDLKAFSKIIQIKKGCEIYCYFLFNKVRLVSLSTTLLPLEITL